MSMDIDRTIAGDFVKFAHRTAGTYMDQRKAVNHLVVDQSYQVARIEVHDWYTDVFLKDFGDYAFNSVMFDNIEPFPDKGFTKANFDALLDVSEEALPLIAGERICNDVLPPKDELGKSLAEAMADCEITLEQAITNAKQA